MRPNKLRALLTADRPSIGTRLVGPDPSFVEAVGHTGMFDYVEFLSAYAPFDLEALDNLCRAAELFDMSSIVKIDQEPRCFLAQRGVGAGFQGVLFADCASADDVRQCVATVRPDTPEDGGTYGAERRRFPYMIYAGSPEYVQALRDVVVAIMIEKRSAVDDLAELLAVPGVDMIQWGPADYSMSIGRPGERDSPDVKAAERKVIDTALQMGVPPRAEIMAVDQAKYYLDLGVRHFSIGIDMVILHDWWKTNGEALRKEIGPAAAPPGD